jgi:hypothetical protein
MATGENFKETTSLKSNISSWKHLLILQSTAFSHRNNFGHFNSVATYNKLNRKRLANVNVSRPQVKISNLNVVNVQI